MDFAPFYWCWFSPDPRMLLFPDEFKTSRSLRKAIREERFEIRIDHDFRSTIEACASRPSATMPRTTLPLRPRIFHPLPPSATMIKRRKPRTSHPLLPPCPTFLRPLPWEATNHPLLPPYPTCPHRPPPRTMMIRAKRTPRSRHRLPAHPRKEKPPALPARQAFRASRPSSLVENRANRLSPSRRESPRPRALRSPVRPSLEANHHHPPEVDPGRSV